MIDDDVTDEEFDTYRRAQRVVDSRTFTSAVERGANPVLNHRLSPPPPPRTRGALESRVDYMIARRDDGLKDSILRLLRETHPGVTFSFIYDSASMSMQLLVAIGNLDSGKSILGVRSVPALSLPPAMVMQGALDAAAECLGELDARLGVL